MRNRTVADNRALTISLETRIALRMIERKMMMRMTVFWMMIEDAAGLDLCLIP